MEQAWVDQDFGYTSEMPDLVASSMLAHLCLACLGPENAKTDRVLSVDQRHHTHGETMIFVLGCSKVRCTCYPTQAIWFTDVEVETSCGHRSPGAQYVCVSRHRTRSLTSSIVVLFKYT